MSSLADPRNLGGGGSHGVAPFCAEILLLRDLLHVTR